MFYFKLKSNFLTMTIFILTLFFISFESYAKDFVIDKIVINGEKRISESLILKYIPKLKNRIINDNILNNLTKNLYGTGYFSDIVIKIDQKILNITVEEFPIINQVLFSGNELLSEEILLSITNIKTRDVFNKKIINKAIENIQSEYQKIGYYLSVIKTKKINLPEGRVNLVFEIKEGNLLVVKNINFTGNKIFSDSDLSSVVSTKEDAWYKIFAANKFVPSRLEFDKDKLYQFYKQRGFINFKVRLARGDLLPDFSGFNINFIVEEGSRFKINDIKIKSEFKDQSSTELLKQIPIKSGDYYDSRALNESTLIINEHFAELGYSFVKIIPKLKQNKDLVNITLTVNEGNKNYINKISILGNNRTLDSVIRREILILEGDPFNSSKLKESINALKRLGYFNSVKYRIERGILDNSVDIIINVEEMNTGSVSFGVGYSSLNSTSMTFGLNEKNFLGEGRKARFEATISDKKSTYNVGITEPYFLNKPISFNTNIYNEVSENSKGDIKSDEFGLGLGLGIKEKSISHSLGLSFAEVSSSTSSTSTAASVTGEEGQNIITSSIKYSIFKDTRDNLFNPSNGYKWSIFNTFAGLGGDSKFIKSVAKYQVHYPVNYNDFTIAFKTGVGSVTSLDDKVTRSNRFNLGGRVIRGFDNGGIGPRDTGNKQVVGGNNFYNISTELRSDKYMPDDTGIEWLLFTDIASLWGTDYETGVEGFEDIEPRISSGFGFLMKTAVGPLQFLWGFPMQSKSYDVEENFQFSIGTNF